MVGLFHIKKQVEWPLQYLPQYITEQRAPNYAVSNWQNHPSSELEDRSLWPVHLYWRRTNHCHEKAVVHLCIYIIQSCFYPKRLTIFQNTTHAPVFCTQCICWYYDICAKKQNCNYFSFSEDYKKIIISIFNIRSKVKNHKVLHQTIQCSVGWYITLYCFSYYMSQYVVFLYLIRRNEKKEPIVYI